jgi:hypothetical protein
VADLAEVVGVDGAAATEETGADGAAIEETAAATVSPEWKVSSAAWTPTATA